MTVQMPLEHPPAEIARIGRVVHEALRAYGTTIGQPRLPSWRRAPAWMKETTLAGIRFVLSHPDAGEDALHALWMDTMQASGWTCGPARNARRKTHPMLVPYASLPAEERRKDAILIALVKACASA